MRFRKSIPNIIDSSIEISKELYNSGGEKVTVNVPKDQILVKVSQEDKTIYFLDTKTYINLDKYTDEDGSDYIVVKKKTWEEASKKMAIRQKENERFAMIAQLNNEGIALEKEGKEDEAIAIYEKNVSIKCDATHSYDRLLVIYKRRKDTDNEIRIAKIASCVFPENVKYRNRLESLLGINQNGPIYPTETVACNASIKHGDLLEDLILELPEFDFYNNGANSNAYKVEQSMLSSFFEIQDYFKDLIQKAELAESRKDYVNAAMIYEQVIAENYWMPTPCDRLVKIYSKAKLEDDEKRVLQYGINHFSTLREKRLSYIKSLAEKNNAIQFFEERINSGGKITYYNGVFELYNPFPIVEKWIERWEKKYYTKP